MAAEAALSFAVETLGKLLIEKAVFLKGVKEEVEWLLLLYNHHAVAGGFEFRGWVVVSNEFNPEDVMKQILKPLGFTQDPMHLEDRLNRQEELKEEAHKRLAGKRYFIVLDDVWKAEESLSKAFPDGDNGSRLLLTSRNPVITNNTGYVHNMEPVNAIESCDLFMRKAFGGNSSIYKCLEELKKVGEGILKRCGGLPLAISMVGCLLAKKTRSKAEWEKVHKEMNSPLDIYKSGGDPNTITAILELSYHNLTTELKACFLCFGFFREDAIVKVKKLVHIWVAQGLVAQEVEGEEVRMEDVARHYLNELISRNMVQVKEMKYDKLKACQMHDLLRDLSIRKAKEDIDFEMLREEQNSSHQSLAKPRHRAIHYSETSFVYFTDRNQHLRSPFVHCYYQEWQFISSSPSSYWKSFQLLRVLDLGNAMFPALPKGIGEMTGLRYLKMRCRRKRVSKPPRSWPKLKNLEVLDLLGFPREHRNQQNCTEDGEPPSSLCRCKIL